MPTVPVGVWEQISVVVVFAFLLAGLGWVLVRMFTSAIADVNAHYARVLSDSNTAWQKYFDARSESANLVSAQMMDRMEEIAGILKKLASDFDAHDHMERQALDEMSNRRKLSGGNTQPRK